jgi:hypothetical protein
MQKKFLLPFLAAAALLCGCDSQTKINTEKIEVLSEKMVQLQLSQARQMEQFQTQLTSLAPMLDKMNSIYFEKTRDDALFYHTNTLFLLLTVDKNIESELGVADAKSEAQNLQAHDYHTNEMDMMHFYAAQIQDAMAAQEVRIRDAMAGQQKQIEDNVNAQTRQVGAGLGDELLKQIKLSAPDPAETARLKELEADVTQIRRDLDQIETQLGQMTNRTPIFYPPPRPAAP